MPRGRKPKEGADAFYADCMEMLGALDIPFAIGGTVAINFYTGMERPTKDLDLFCTPGDYPKIIAAFSERGFETDVIDERWLAKVVRDPYFCDLIFGFANLALAVHADWFKRACAGTFFGVEGAALAPTELFAAKAFIKDRLKYDGSDIAHLIYTQHRKIDWKRLLAYLDPYWEVLLIHILNFRFIYPSERERIPRWLLDELLGRLERQRDLSTPRTKICRGGLFSRNDYRIDVEEWGFADVVGDDAAGRERALAEARKQAPDSGAPARNRT